MKKEHKHTECHHHEHGCGCGCGHDHHHHDEKESKKKIIQIIVAALIFILGMVSEHVEEMGKIIDPVYFFIVSYLIIGVEVVISAIKNIFKGNLFNEAFLMSLATICAFVVSEYSEAVVVMLLYQIGELLQDQAIEKSYNSIKTLLNLKKSIVHIVDDKDMREKFAEDVKKDDICLVKPGEKIALDGVIIEGSTTLDVSSLSGEVLPVEKIVGDQVLSGSVNLTGVIKYRVVKEFEDSTVSKIMDCIESNPGNKTKSEKFVTRFAKIYTPIVCCLALLIVVIPAILQLPLQEWIYRACTFLVVSCPCALVVSIPLAYFVSIGVSSRNGMLIKGSNNIENLNKSNTILFDKTGTLTTGELKVSKIVSRGKEEELLESIVLAEIHSNHPISKSIKKAFKIDESKYEIKDYKEVTGQGVKVCVGTDVIKAGRIEFVSENTEKNQNESGVIIHVSKNDNYLGYVVIDDSIKSNAKEVVEELKMMQVEPIMVSGDNKINAEKISNEIGIDKVYYELLPHQKVEVLDKHLYQDNKQTVTFVGDGINDAPVISKSDVGIAMGGLGSDAAIEVSDIVIMNDNLDSIVNVKKISKATMKIVNENIIIVIGVKAAAIIASAFGELPMWAAIFSDVGVCVLTILNSLRLFRFYKKRKNV